jgi:precorrin isomerase
MDWQDPSTTVLLHDLYSKLGMMKESEGQRVLTDITMMKAAVFSRCQPQDNGVESMVARINAL